LQKTFCLSENNRYLSPGQAKGEQQLFLKVVDRLYDRMVSRVIFYKNPNGSGDGAYQGSDLYSNRNQGIPIQFHPNVH